jgi:hypothetical protein
MSRCETKTLTKADIAKIEEALDSSDLEVMVAAVDRIVERRLRSARKAAGFGVQAARAVDHVYAAR